MLAFALTSAAGLFATAAIAADARGWRQGFALAKPVPIILLLLLLASENGSGSYSLFVFAGLAFSLVGDVLLLDREKGFRGGLANFLIAHVAYILAFWHCASALGGWAFALCLALAAGYTARLWARLGREKLPVTIYAAAIAAMLALAFSQPLALPGILTMAGAGLFALSDACLAWNRFVAPLRHAQAVILGTYYLAQALIAWSTLA